jgi:hypothetical protein
MSTTHRDKSGGKPRQRSRKTDKPGQKAEQPQSPKPDQRDEDQIDPMIAATDAPTNGAAAPAAVPASSEVEPTDVPQIGEVEPAALTSTGAAVVADHHPINIQTIANEYRDYTRKSFEESRFFVEKLMGVRSFDKAVEVQTEFARRAYANFVAESQRMCELYNAFVRQTFRPWEEITTRMNQTGR